MKVIFLDFDGVLNVIPQGHDEYGGIFHPEFVQNLERIIQETGAKLVISSSWRHGGVERMRAMWKHRGYPGEIIGITPDLWRGVKDEEFHERLERGHEIEAWLKQHPEVNTYVILDDDDDMLSSQRGNFVQTSNNINHPDCIDIGYGLTKVCTNRAIRILNKQSKDMKEYVLCAAIWYKDLPMQKPEILENRGFRPYNVDKGVVISGWRHGNCIYQISAITGLRSVPAEAGESIQGFLTSRNRFVDRKEGGEIAFAAGQTTELKTTLYSEDLY